MDEDDHDELLQCTDDESLSDNEDQCLPIDKPEETYRQNFSYYNHTKLEFLTTKLVLICSTTAILILFPLYLEAVNVAGNAYSLILTNTLLTTIFFLVTVCISKCFFDKFRNIKVLSFPLKFPKLIQLSSVYFLCGFMILYALDRKRVLCHLQDPIKGVVLVFSLLCYFFFCRKFMGLQRIFSTTTIIVGLFIAVDYGLCDEFRCRGYERERMSEDTGSWSWQTHAIWTTVYIVGLALFAAYFSILDRYVLAINEMEHNNITMPTNFLSTVSSSVSYPNGSNLPPQLERNTANESNHHQLPKKYSVLLLAMWIHVIGLIFVVTMFWTDFIPAIGKGSSSAESWNHTLSGFICHFKIPSAINSDHSACGNVFVFSWFFLLSYVCFAVVSVKFLVLSQSAVYTIATMTSSLPLVGIWWSLFHAAPHSNGFLLWSPSITGELICSLLGLPIILIGLFLLYKAHLKDYQWCQLSHTNIISGNNYA